jgi:U3 small nucleolar RNA-associated protein 7
MSNREGGGERQHDPNGTLEVARGGMTEKDARKIRHEKLQSRPKADQERIAAYLEGPHGYESRKRLEAIREDDKDMKLDKLNDYQKRALQKRKRRGNDRVLRAKMNRHETKRLEAAVAAADAQVVLHTEAAGLVEAEHDMERTTALTQVELKRKHLNEKAAQNIYDLRLTDYGPYGMTFDRSGRCSILFGQKGHMALMDCHHRSLKTEFYVQERVRDATFLHNTMLFAAAQANHVFIYDDAGTEIHRLDEHNDPFRLQFLPYHWLLASVGRAGWLKYHDTSTGELVSQHRTRLGACQVMRQNPSNAVMHLGHHNGVVTLWSPASSQYLVKMLCHKGSPITSMVVDRTGHYMVTGGADRQVKIWDLRMYKETHAYFTPAGAPTTLDISQRGVLGIGHAGHATFWSPKALLTKVKDPYMHHAMAGCGPVETLRFRPFEDVAGIGHAKGISSIVIPGSGEPNLDSMEYNTNPHQDKQQRREEEVRALLDKLSPDMIALDPDVVGGVELSDPHRRLERIRDIQEEANAKAALASPKKQKSKKRGRSKIQTKLRRKQKNIVDEQTVKLREARDQEKADREKELKQSRGEAHAESLKDSAPTALKRFFQ